MLWITLWISTVDGLLVTVFIRVLLHWTNNVLPFIYLQINTLKINNYLGKKKDCILRIYLLFGDYRWDVS